MKKTVSLLMVLSLMIGLVAGCGKDKPKDTGSVPPVGTVSSPNAEEILSTADVTYIDANGESVYRVVRPNDPDITSAASGVCANLKKVLGVSVKNTLDESDGTDEYEVLVGKTNRPESAQALDVLRDKTGGRYQDYIICTIGKKIVINAFTVEALNQGCTYFSDNFVKPEGIKGGIYYAYATVGDFKNITVNGESLGKFSIVRPHYNSSYLTQVEIEAMRDSVIETAGYAMDIEEDMYVEEGGFEIIVGNTNRSGIESIANHDEYHITIKGDKVYLNGGSPHATAVAVTEFNKLLSNGAVTDADSRTGSYEMTVSGYDKSRYYTHVWGDDFDGTEIDPTKWDIITEEHYGKGADGMSGQNGKRALRVPEANVIKNGCLYQLQYYDDVAYYGGTIRTNNHMKFLFGYLEHSVITPDNPSSWNTLWMSSVESNGIIGPEIDLNENFGNPAVTDANAHVWPGAGAASNGWVHRSFDQIRANESKYKLPSGDTDNLNTGFHTFGFLWRDDYIAFTGDGKIYCDLNLDEEGFEDYKVAYTTVAVKVIIAASPGVGSGPKDTSTAEHWENSKSDYVTDYVHIYQLQDGLSRMEIDY